LRERKGKRRGKIVSTRGAEKGEKGKEMKLFLKMKKEKRNPSQPDSDKALQYSRKYRGGKKNGGSMLFYVPEGRKGIGEKSGF